MQFNRNSWVKPLAGLSLLGALLCSPLSLAADAVNINTADAATLAAALNGIGLARAEAIVEYRSKHGPFKTADDLLAVVGVGQATLDKNRQIITVN